MGARGPFLQHRESRGIELVDHIAHGLVVAAQQPSNRRGSFPARRCSQDLAATHHKGIGRTQSRLDLVLFVLGERSDKNGCSHTSYCTTLPTTSGGIALGGNTQLAFPYQFHSTEVSLTQNWVIFNSSDLLLTLRSVKIQRRLSSTCSCAKLATRTSIFYRGGTCV